MDVPSFGADVQPLTLEGQVTVSYSAERQRRRTSVRVRVRPVKRREPAGYTEATDNP